MTTKNNKNKRSFKYEKNNYTPFFQTIYFFHFLFILMIQKITNVKFATLKMIV
jgi:hypothetical protein